MRAWPVLLLLGLAGSQPSKLLVPDETAGLDRIVQTLVSAFDHVDIVALGENHWNKMDSDLRIALVRSTEFAKKARFIVVEFASTRQQATLDRYIRGDDVLPAAAQVRVLAGDPPSGSGLGRDNSAFSILQEQVLKTHGKALLIYGAGHLLRAVPDPIPRITKMLDNSYPGSTFVVTTEGGPHPEYQEFERALKTPARPVLVSLGKPPFRDLLVRAFPGLGLTRGQIADACVYFGIGPEVEVRVSPDR